jgi:hypothetical protein
MYAVFLGKAVQTVNPPDGSVSLAKLSATGTKDSTTFLRGDNTFATPSVASLSTASGSAPSYSARAWVNFNGTGTVAIRGSGNVSSITDNGTGDYTINFTTDMPDVNYSIVAMGGRSSTIKDQGYVLHHSLQVGNFTLETTNTAATLVDYQQPTVAVFR